MNEEQCKNCGNWAHFSKGENRETVCYKWTKEFPKRDGDFFYSGKLPSGKDFVGIVQVITNTDEQRYACVYIPMNWRGSGEKAALVYGRPEDWTGEWSGPEFGLSCVEVTP